MSEPSPTDALPVLAVAEQLLAALDEPGAAVLVAPPGTGKTTGVPPLLAERPWARGARIVVVEPRRLAARAAASRMAAVSGTRLGERVGYSVRGERRVGPATRIEVVTEGLFLRRLQADPTLDGVAAVLLDEFHERSSDADLALALVCDVRASLRPDLRLVVMSATIDPAPLAALMGAPATAVPVIEATAPMFPIETRYRPGSAHDPLEDRVADVIRESLRDDSGDVLVFLPGRAEIRRVGRALGRGGSTISDRVEVAELHGSLSPDEQDHVVRPAEVGRRRVILSTSLAETSITVPGVRVVIDAGRRRNVRVDPHTGLPALRTGPVSRAGADQRRGRAGRVGPGIAYRLWAEADERHRPAADTPELVDGDLAPTLLQLRSWGVEDPAELRWLDPPPAEPVQRATTLLTELGALDPTGRLTARGRDMADIGFHPRLASIALEGRRLGRRDVAAEVIAVLETSRSGDVDLAERVRALRDGRATGDVLHALRMWRRSLEVDRSDDGTPLDAEQLDEVVARLVLAGYSDRLARRRDRARSDDRGRSQAVYHLRSGGEVAVATDDAMARSRWWVVADLDAGAPGVPGRPHLVAALSDRLVTDLVDPLVLVDELVVWDPRRRDVVAERRRHLGAITLSSEPVATPDAAALGRALVEGIRTQGLGLLPRLDQADDLRRRVGWLRATRPDEDWPDWTDEALLAHLDLWLVPVLGRARRASDLGRVDVRSALLGQLDWARRRSVDELAPTHWTTTSGRRVALRYGDVDGAPATVVAAVALRDVIGTDVQPTVGSSRVPITFELLSPAGRPLQRTADLPGFWRGSYASVRAEMRGRYPKHPWPERPWEPLPPRRRPRP